MTEPHSYKKLFDLTGKVAVVTGGAGLLGKHFCCGLAESGACVAVVDLEGPKAVALAAELQSAYGVPSIGMVCDVSDPDSVAAMVDSVCDRLGDIQILHNNAASKSLNLEEFFAPFETYSLEEWNHIMSVNLDGMFLVAQHIGKSMVAHGKGGSIVQTASIYGIMAPDQRIYEGSRYLGMEINTPAVYSASKAGVVGLTKYLASYWADKNIRVNTLTPGGTESGQNNEFVSKYSQRVPMARMAAPHEMVGALLFLASEASSYVTGQNLVVDGGLSVW
jgi:NAD(P)-dependent dehydrogenase (short-subunit alcohol dehydrogenase family)